VASSRVRHDGFRCVGGSHGRGHFDRCASLHSSCSLRRKPYPLLHSPSGHNADKRGQSVILKAGWVYDWGPLALTQAQHQAASASRGKRGVKGCVCPPSAFLWLTRCRFPVDYHFVTNAYLVVLCSVCSCWKIARQLAVTRQSDGRGIEAVCEEL